MNTQFNISSKLLATLNLSEAQLHVYLAALQLGQGTMQDLARISGVKRSTIYTFIETLKARQLITETKRKKTKLYSAAPPEQLVKLEQDRLEQLQHFLPQLQLMAAATRSKPQVTYFEQRAGIRQVFDTILEVKATVYSIENLELFASSMSQAYEDIFVAERVKRGIALKAIVHDSAYNRRYFTHNVGRLRDCKFVAMKNIESELLIFGEYTAIFNYDRRHAYAVLIHDARTAKSMRQIWETLWQRIK